MFHNSRYRAGTYRATFEKYELREALAVAVAVDRAQGFVKSGMSGYDSETETHIYDNRTRSLEVLRRRANKETAENASTIPGVDVTDADFEQGQKIFKHFDEVLVMDKLSDDLVKVSKDGAVNDYNANLSRIFDADVVDVNKDLAMIVSLPNSFRTAAKRQEMTDFWDANRENGYVGHEPVNGAKGERLDLRGVVKDIKYIRNHNIFLVSVFTDDQKIVKFFMPERFNERAQKLVGETLEFRATVKKHSVNPYTKCQETMVNRPQFKNLD